jgi:hypothetical protein
VTKTIDRLLAGSEEAAARLWDEDVTQKLAPAGGTLIPMLFGANGYFLSVTLDGTIIGDPVATLREAYKGPWPQTPEGLAAQTRVVAFARLAIRLQQAEADRSS